MNERLIPLEREVANFYEPWMLWVFLVALALLAVVRIQFPTYAQLVHWNFSNYRIARQAYAENEPLIHPSWLLMMPVTILGFGLFTQLALHSVDGACAGLSPVMFLRICAILVIGLLLRLLAVDLIHTLAGKTTVLRIYLGNVLILNQSVGVLLLVLALVMAVSYGGADLPVVVAGLVLFGLAYMLRLIRGVLAAINERISLNYIILYLCALEFLPLAVMVKAWMLTRTGCA